MRRGLKRPLVGQHGGQETTQVTTRSEQLAPSLEHESDDTPTPNYTVYTYIPELCDRVLQEEKVKGPVHLPNVKCSGCNATFAQKSIFDYDLLWEEFSSKNYADLQFHQYNGGLCLWCRAPYQGEGHFEETLVNPLTKYLNAVLCTTSLHDIVWGYCKQQVLPEYTRLMNKHYAYMMDDDADDNMLQLRGMFAKEEYGRSYMKVRGVELVYWHPQTPCDSVPDVKLDYRFFRPKECKCTWTPCECICFVAQVENIKEILHVPYHHQYKILCTLWNTKGGILQPKIDRNKYQSCFVYLRYWSEVNPEDEEAVNEVLGEDAKLTDNVWGIGSVPEEWISRIRSEGVCRTVFKEEQDEVVTVHTLECRRRNHPYSSYKCMMNESRCGRCADCEVHFP